MPAPGPASRKKRGKAAEKADAMQEDAAENADEMEEAAVADDAQGDPAGKAGAGRKPKKKKQDEDTLQLMLF